MSFRRYWGTTGSFIILFCCLFSSVVRSEEIPQQVLDWQQAAEQCIVQKDYLCAIEKCQQIINVFPNTPYAMNAQGRIITLSLETGNRSAADTELEVMMQQYSTVPGYPEAIFEISRAYRWAAKDPAKGRELCNYLLEQLGSDSRTSGIQCAIVKTYMEEKNRIGADAALEKYKQFCTGKPEEIKEVSHLVDVYINDFKCPTKAAELYQWYLSAYPQNENAALLYAAAIEIHLKMNQRTEADTMLNQMISRYADEVNFGDAIYDLARHYRWLVKDYAKGRELYMLWLSKYGDKSNAYQTQGGVVKTYLEERDVAGADVAFEQFKGYCQDQPGIWDTVSKLADDYRKGCQRPDRAVELYRWFMNQYPNHEKLMGVRCAEIKTLMEANRESEAKSQITTLLTLKDRPDFVPSVHDLGWSFLTHKDYVTALEIYMFLRDQFPDHERAPWFQRSIIQTCMAMEDSEQIDTELEYFFSHYSTHQKYVEQGRKLASIFNDRNDTSRAVEVYAKLLETHPYDSQAIWIHVDLIKTYRKMGATGPQIQEALETLLRSYSSYGDYAKVMNNLGDAFRSYGRFADSISLYQAALDSTPDKPERLCAIAGMAKAQIRMGLSISDPNTPGGSTTEDPNSMTTVKALIADYSEVKGLGFHVFQIGEEYYFRAEESLKKGNDEQAKDDFLKAIAIWEKNRTQLTDSLHQAHAIYYSGDAFKKMGQYEQAIECFRQIVIQRPDYENAWNAQYSIAGCYDRMCQENIITKKERDTNVKQVLMVLVEKYPNCPAARLAQREIDRISK